MLVAQTSLTAPCASSKVPAALWRHELESQNSREFIDGQGALQSCSPLHRCMCLYRYTFRRTRLGRHKQTYLEDDPSRR